MNIHFPQVVLIVVSFAFAFRPCEAGENVPSASGRVISPPLPSVEKIEGKLDGIHLPDMEFKEVSFREVVSQIHKAASEADANETDPKSRGVNMVVKVAKEDDLMVLPFTATLKAGSLRESLNMVAAAAKLKIKVEPYAVAFVPQSEPTDPLITKEYASPGPVFASIAVAGKSASARDFLQSQGIGFPPGASAQMTADGRLVVRSTEPALRQIEVLMDGPGVSSVR